MMSLKSMRDKIVSVFKGADRVMRGKAVDTDFWIEKYLNETQHQIKETYRYESAFNLQDYLNVLQFSPGLEELLKLRKKIYAKKEIISKIKIGKKEFEQDKVKAKLKKLIDNYDQMRRHFLSDITRINMVMNNDKLSFSETYRIRQKLNDIGMIIDTVFINKLIPNDNVDEIVNEFKTQKIIKFPLFPKNITGLSELKAYIGKYNEIFVQGLG
ncbi:MAG: ArsA-related P-loop ATPase [Desulfobacterales bacterium]|jgi:hypothetical protein